MKPINFKIMLFAVGATLILGPRPASAGTRGKILHAFGDYGNTPYGGVTFDTSGNLYGTVADPFQCQFGPPCGGVYKLSPTPDGKWHASLVHQFSFEEGSLPLAGVTIDSAGNLYGVGEDGGDPSCGQHHSGCGVAFQLTHSRTGWTETVLHTFSGGADGASPIGGLILDAAGNLYGTASQGGNLSCGNFSGCGVVFKLSPGKNGDSWTQTVIHTFSGTDGSCPAGSLVMDATGNLYGTAGNDSRGCGYTSPGLIFQLVPSPDGSWQENILHTFSGTDGEAPVGSLSFDSVGNLYGATAYGGSSGLGVVFELAPGPKWQETVLHSFNGTDGSLPQAGVTLDSAGNLYGTTFYGGGDPNCDFGGCGVVFQLSHGQSGWKERVLPFTGSNGERPSAVLILDSQGNLYGTTISGGPGGGGEVYEILKANRSNSESPH